MSNLGNHNLAEKYVVDDIAGAHQIGSRLHGILDNIDAGFPVSKLARDFLAKSGLACLCALVEGQIDLDAFQHSAAIERKLRMEQADLAARKAVEDAAELKAKRMAASAAIFNDPAYRRRQEAKQLRRQFGLGYIEPEHYPRVMRLLALLGKRNRLPPGDVVWLQTEAEDCWTDQVASTWHGIEAEALADIWRVTGDPWAAVNASSHWRKCEQPENALRLTEEALAVPQATNAKVQSALATTRGGALRDVNRLAEAKAAGEQAHMLMPKDYRPCTLLGAVYFGLHNFSAGLEWFEKAEELGATQSLVEHDISASLARLPDAERGRLRAFLLDYDPERFVWLNAKRRYSRKNASGKGRREWT